MYPDSVEYFPPNALPPRGSSIHVICFIDIDHVGDKITSCYQSGIILYCNKSPIVWNSKSRDTVEISIFGSKFVALQSVLELIISLRYKLWMLIIPISSHANIFCGNEYVYKNTDFDNWTLKKKHNSIFFHCVKECVTADIMIFVRYIPSTTWRT